ncbi:Phosphorylated CTD interacting factor PCIF1 [Giardia lamblia P15]|uniref:Phosphorylated CTD interacting factor PCIF1 n=1 Tax=Giardia intestinalis (strain P15) TaxID=658858 RepID=E1F5C5_GIAIA|nr:Phosphorylated CTD interacting factor PCIF1 [Giardia lamblia P15]
MNSRGGRGNQRGGFDKRRSKPKNTPEVEEQPYDFSFLVTDYITARTTPVLESMRKKIEEGAEDVPIPSLASELLLASFVKDMRTWFKEEVRKELFTYPQKETLNRWLFDMLATPSESIAGEVGNNLLKYPKRLKDDPDVIARELFLSIPMRIKPSYPDTQRLKSDAIEYRKISMQFLTRMKARFEKQAETDEQTRKDLDQLEGDLLAFDPTVLHIHVLEARLKVASESATAFVSKYLKSDVHSICNRLADLAMEYSTKKPAFTDDDFEVILTAEGIEHTVEAKYTVKLPDNLSHGLDLKFKLSSIHFYKLRELYKKTSGKRFDPDMKIFNKLLFILLRRYHTFFGTERFEGTSFHAAAPENIFRRLKSFLDVSQECFASPLNCFFSQFCSAFPEIDIFFGSLGSFFDYDIIEGSFECGPPYTLECMDRTAKHIIQTLDKSENRRPIMFVVFVPEWRVPPAQYHLDLEESAYTRFHFCAPGGKHYYVSGEQHEPKCIASKGALTNEKVGRYYLVPHGTHVYFVCNDAGFKRYAKGSEDYLEKAADDILRVLMDPLDRNDNNMHYARDYVTVGDGELIDWSTKKVKTDQVQEPKLKMGLKG